MAIIALSGRMGSGKDEVGKIIQYLTSELEKTDVSYQEFSKRLPQLPRSYNNTWQIKKYADKLKDIVCLLIGCTREQLEDREFKEKKLGEEWWVYGAYQHGFNSDILEGIYSTEKEASHILNYNRMNRVELIKLTPRKILQLLGTEAGRQIIHPNIWVNALMSEYNSECKCVYQQNSGKNCSDCPELPNWIITDMRFPNELEAVKAKGGVTIRINRPETDHLAGDHASETALDNAEFDYVIDNVGSLQDLINKIKEILVDENLL